MRRLTVRWHCPSHSAPVARPRPENTHTGRWTKEEHAKFLEGIKLYGKEWKKIASMVRLLK